MNKLWLWFRLVVSNHCCMAISILAILLSFVVPIIWIFTFIPVCRAFDPSGYWATLGILLAYTAVCACVWLTWCGGCTMLHCAGDIPGSTWNEGPESIELSWAECEARNAELRAGWLASLSDPSGAAPEGTPYGDYIKKENDRVATRAAKAKTKTKTNDYIAVAGSCYIIAAVVLFPLALLGIMPLILVHTSTYGAAFGLGCAFVGIYIGAAAGLIIVPMVGYWLTRKTWEAGVDLWEYLVGTYQVAATVSDGFAPTPV